MPAYGSSGGSSANVATRWINRKRQPRPYRSKPKRYRAVGAWGKLTLQEREPVVQFRRRSRAEENIQVGRARPLCRIAVAAIRLVVVLGRTHETGVDVLRCAPCLEDRHP